MTKNLIPEVLKLLGVEYGEKFKLNNIDGVITEDDVFCFLEHGLSRVLPDGVYEDASDILYDIFAGNYEMVELPWEPKEGERYFYPSINAKRVDCTNWTCCSFDYAMKALGMIYKTPEEAQAHFAEDYEKLTGKKLEG